MVSAETKILLAAIIISFCLPFIIMGAIYIKIHKGLLWDRYNLIFRKNRVVKVNFRTRTGRNLERYLVPDKAGLFHINGGAYAYIEELSSINTRYRIPEITILEGQVAPPTGNLVFTEREVEVSVLQEDKTIKKEMKKIPTYIVSFATLKPEKLNGLIAEEIELALNSHIVSDILTASDRTLKRIEMMFIMTCIMLGALVLFALIVFAMLNGIKNDLEVLQLAAAARNGL